jgi:hypothetical protein
MKGIWRSRLAAAAPGSRSQRPWLQRPWLQRPWLQRPWLQRPWLQRLFIGASVMVIAVVAGVAIPALAGGKSVTFYACVTSKTGAIKVVSKSARCHAGQHKISWNNVGPQGPAGQTGQPGPAGVVTGYSAVAHGGTISTSSTAVTSLTLPTGSFIVNASVYLDISSSEAETTNVADCRLTDGSGAVLDTSAATVVLTGNTGATTLSLTGATSKGGTTQVLCTSGSTDNLDTASITAIPVHTLS